MNAANLKTELVDWKILNGQGASGKSDELMRHVATLFALTAEHCTEEQIETYDTVLQRLADLVDAETRSFAAKKICHLEKAPYPIIRRFAFDTIRVAAPVLRHSPLLTDEDLIEVSDLKGETHMIAISMRQDLNSTVTDVLIRHEHGSVLIKLAANDNAEFSAVGMSILKHASEQDPELAGSLANRQPQNAAHIQPVNRNVPQNKHLDMARLWEALAPNIPASVYDLRMHGYLGRYDFGPSLFKISKLHERGLLDKAILRQYASNDQFADLVCGVSQLSHLPHAVVARLMASFHWDQVLSLFKVLAFSDRLLESLLTCGPWKLCLSRNQCVAILKQYQQLSVEEARSRVLLWPEQGLVLD